MRSSTPNNRYSNYETKDSDTVYFKKLSRNVDEKIRVSTNIYRIGHISLYEW